MGRGAGDQQFTGKGEEKPEKAVEVEGVAAVKEAVEGKVEQPHAPVERQDSRSKHRPLAKVPSAPQQQGAPAPQGERAAPAGKGASSPQASSPVSATPPTGKQGKRTERPKSPPSGGAQAQK